MLADGADVNERDFDRLATPLHWACGRGNLEAIELLIDFEADVNAQDKRGRTPLHTLIEMRFDTIALWLIQYCNADPHIADKRNITPFDLCQNFFKIEVDNAIANRGSLEFDDVDGDSLENIEKEIAELNRIKENNQTSESYVHFEVFKVYLPTGSYKSVRINGDMTASDVLETMTDKINWPPEYAVFLELFEVRKRDFGTARSGERKVAKGERVFDIKQQWPLITEEGVNATEKYFFLKAKVSPTAPDNVKNTRIG